MRRPYPPLLVRVAVSTVILWLLLRAVYAIVLIFGSSGGGLFSPSDAMNYAVHPAWLVRIGLAFVTVLLVRLDRSHAHEHLLQANFGVAGTWFNVTSMIAAMLTDGVFQTLVYVLDRAL